MIAPLSPGASSKKSPIKFFVLIYALSIPFWVLSTLVKVEGLPDNLPVIDIGAVFAPTIAASILVYGEEKIGGVMRLFSITGESHRMLYNNGYNRNCFMELKDIS